MSLKLPTDNKMDVIHILNKYAEEINNGTILSCEYVKLAVKRYLKDLTRKDIYFDTEAAIKAVNFFPYLKHYKGAFAGQSFVLEPWQVFIVANLFGWKRKADGFRRFNKSVIEIPRKAGKTTLAAGVALYMFVGDGEPGAEIYTAATTREQARICFNDARQMAMASPDISKRVEILSRNMNILKSARKFEYVSSDYGTLDGLNPHEVTLDEVHAYKTSGLHDIFESATGARTQPITFIITTAGFKKQWWYYKDLRSSVINILKGKIKDDSTFGIIFTLDEKDDWQDQNVWIKANPGLGVNITTKYLAKRVNDAKVRPSELVNVMTKHFNVWTDAAKIWIDSKKWADLAIEEPQLEGLVAYGGVDLSYVRDICGYTLNFKLPDGNTYLKQKFFVPYDTAIIRQQATGFPYMDWITEGHLIACDGDTIDYNVLKFHILEDIYKYNIHTIGFDRANANHIMQEINEVIPKMRVLLKDKWQMVDKVYGISPNMTTISPPTKEFERRILCQKPEIRHDGNPVMDWMMSNVVLKYDPMGNIRPDKDKSEEKIDGVMSSILALEQELFWESYGSKAGSKYETDDLMVF